MNDATWILIWKHIDKEHDVHGQLILIEDESMTQPDLILLTALNVIVCPADKLDFQRRYSISGRPIFHMHVTQPDRVPENHD
jgi:hypothetical protein